ncbi:MAG: hypothetical protein WBG76_04015 [Ornithinimicrobium sp.]
MEPPLVEALLVDPLFFDALRRAAVVLDAAPVEELLDAVRSDALPCDPTGFEAPAVADFWAAEGRGDRPRGLLDLPLTSAMVAPLPA